MVTQHFTTSSLPTTTTTRHTQATLKRSPMMSHKHRKLSWQQNHTLAVLLMTSAASVSTHAPVATFVAPAHKHTPRVSTIVDVRIARRTHRCAGFRHCRCAPD
jgi:hypothetical protein